jgi:hypothetical protein
MSPAREGRSTDSRMGQLMLGDKGLSPRDKSGEREEGLAAMEITSLEQSFQRLASFEGQEQLLFCPWKSFTCPGSLPQLFNWQLVTQLSTVHTCNPLSLPGPARLSSSAVKHLRPRMLTSAVATNQRSCGMHS